MAIASGAIVIAACGGGGGGGNASGPPASPTMAPTPFTAAQIRAATKAGRTYRYKVEMTDKPASERTLTFVSVDAEGAMLATTGEPDKRVTWEELRKHAEFPMPIVMTREESITTPAGRFDCIVYVVLGEGGEATTFYFAKTLPGAPVMFFVAREGRRVMTSTLIEHRAGT
jgi:hypothetical protein